jgi:hypothetical protein
MQLFKYSRSWFLKHLKFQLMKYNLKKKCFHNILKKIVKLSSNNSSKKVGNVTLDHFTESNWQVLFEKHFSSTRESCLFLAPTRLPMSIRTTGLV